MGIYTLSKSGASLGANKYKNASGGSLISKTSNYKPVGTTRVFSHTFANGASTTEEGTINSVQGGVFTATELINNKYIVSYATGFAQPTGSGDPLSNGNGIKMNGVPVMNGTSYTFIAWYKGIQTQSSVQTWAATINIFGDPRGSVYLGFGLNNGRIAIGGLGPSGGQTTGSTIISDEKWHMLTWVYKSNNTIDAYVDGNSTPEISNHNAGASPSNNNIDYIGATYPYGNTLSPNVAAAIQIYSQNLTTSQISEIFNAERIYFGV
jgi:Concanavalin A-like lectin/glucanases superfamily